MSRSPNIKEKTTTKLVKNPALLLTATLLDTTWRVMLPGIVGVIIGIMLDHSWLTTPLMTIIGLVLGIALSVYLIYRQFKAVSR
jgi:hypothetical protein